MFDDETLMEVFLSYQNNLQHLTFDNLSKHGGARGWGDAMPREIKPMSRWPKDIPALRLGQLKQRFSINPGCRDRFLLLFAKGLEKGALRCRMHS